MAINPQQIISNKKRQILSFSGGNADQLVNTFSEQLPGLNFTPQTKKSSVKVMDKSSIGVNDVTGTIQEGLGNLSNIIPNNLNNVAQGIGASLENTGNNLLREANGFLDSVSSIATGGFAGLANNALANLEDGIENFFGEFIGDFAKLELSPGELLTNIGVTGSNVGSLTSPEFKPSPKFVKMKNQIRDFASYNCITTFGVISTQSLENPRDTYRKRGADYTILRSGGGGIKGAQRINTAYDFDSGGNLEYFIDDISIKSIVYPNQSTSVSSATTFEFKVYEPYSLGLFLQSLQIAADKAGYQNYLQAIYLLELDFIGWDEDNNPVEIEYTNRRMPIKLANIEFNVENGGSVYDIRAIAYTDISFTDEIQQVQDSISITGSTVADCLTFGEKSLTTYLNTKMQSISTEEGLSSSDLYTIIFPSSITNEASATESGGSATLSELEQERTIFGAQRETAEGGVSQYVQSARQNAGATFDALRSKSISDVNVIGASEQIESFRSAGDHPFGFSNFVYNSETKVYERNSIQLELSDTNREFRFPQGMTIQKIIEEIVLTSGYGRSIAQATEDENSHIPWFKIESEVYHIDDPQFEKVKGRKARIYVYKVIPFDVSISNIVSPNGASTNIANLAGHAVKEFNYIYSGNNEDVLGFDINFNAAFFEAIRADRNNLTTSSVVGPRSNIVSGNSEPDLTTVDETDDIRAAATRGETSSTTAKSESIINNGEHTGGASETTKLTEYARQIHNTLLNSQVDLISADIEIWGDPYFLPDSGIGNYSSQRGPTIAINDQGTMDYQRNEVDVIVNFRTPVDYNDEGVMSFPEDKLGTKAVKGFSGLYKVLTVSSTISGNQFKQTLRLLRRRNQELDGISDPRILRQNPTSAFNPKERNRKRAAPNQNNSEGFKIEGISALGGEVYEALNTLATSLPSNVLSELGSPVTEAVSAINSNISQISNSIESSISEGLEFVNDLEDDLTGFISDASGSLNAVDDVAKSITQSIIQPGSFLGNLSSLANTSDGLADLAAQATDNFFNLGDQIAERSSAQLQNSIRDTIPSPPNVVGNLAPSSSLRPVARTSRSESSSDSLTQRNNSAGNFGNFGSGFA